MEELPSETAERVEVLRGLQLVSVTPEIAVERRLAVERGALIVSVRDDVAGWGQSVGFELMNFYAPVRMWLKA